MQEAPKILLLAQLFHKARLKKKVPQHQEYTALNINDQIPQSKKQKQKQKPTS